MVLICKTFKLIPFHQMMLCANLLKLARWFWKRKFLNFVNEICYFGIIYPWKRAGPFIWINFNPLYPRMLCSKFCLKLAQWFKRRRWKCEKFTDGQTDKQTDRQTDGWWQVIRKAHLSFQLRWTRMSIHIIFLNYCYIVQIWIELL